MTDYDDILARAVSEAVTSFRETTDVAFPCGFVKLQGIHGNSGLVRHFKSVGEETHSDVYEHPSFPLSIRKDTYKGGYTLSVTGLPQLADGPEYQLLEKKRPMYQTLLEVLQDHDVDAGASIYTRVD